MMTRKFLLGSLIHCRSRSWFAIEHIVATTPNSSRLRRLRPQRASASRSFDRKLAASEAKHYQRPAVEQHFDADEQTDDPKTRIGPLPPDHDAQQKRDNTVKQNPTPVRITRDKRRHDPKHPLENQKHGDNQSQQ